MTRDSKVLSPTGIRTRQPKPPRSMLSWASSPVGSVRRPPGTGFPRRGPRALLATTLERAIARRSRAFPDRRPAATLTGSSSSLPALHQGHALDTSENRGDTGRAGDGVPCAVEPGSLAATRRVSGRHPALRERRPETSHLVRGLGSHPPRGLSLHQVVKEGFERLPFRCPLRDLSQIGRAHV